MSDMALSVVNGTIVMGGRQCRRVVNFQIVSPFSNQLKSAWMVSIQSNLEASPEP